MSTTSKTSGAKEVIAKDIKKLHKMVSAKTSSIVLLYANWCMHCISFKPTWETVSNFVNKNKDIKQHVQMLQIESSTLSEIERVNPELYEYMTTTTTSPEKYFPKIMVFMNDKNGKQKKGVFEGDRSETALKKLIMSKVPKESKKVVVQKPVKEPKVKPVKAEKEQKPVKPVAKKQQVRKQPIRTQKKRGGMQVDQNELQSLYEKVKRVLGDYDNISLSSLIHGDDI